MPLKKILIVHPHDRTTGFLKRINNHIEKNFNDLAHYFSVKPNDESHSECLERIKNHPINGSIIFLGHGRSNKLYGGKSDKYEAMVSIEARLESPADFYYNENFINEDNIEVFNDKKVFCLSCDSNNKFADLAIENGAVTFFGFGDIPTSQGGFLERGMTVSADLVNHLKGELNYIIKRSLAYCIKKNLSFRDLLNTIHFITNQEISSILFDSKSFKHRFTLVDYLYYLKKEIKIKGNKDSKLVS